MTTRKQRSKISQQKREIRRSVWPELDEDGLWLPKDTIGWLRIPQTMPLILRIMDMLADKGKPVSPTYLDLWCRTLDDAFVIVTNPREMAYYAGFSGERAESTWATRMRILKRLGFIDFKTGASGPMNYVLMLNPYQVIKQHHETGNLSSTAFTALQTRAMTIGATDLEDAEAVSRDSA